MKLASFLFPGSGGRVQADSDTALIDDVPPTHALDTFAPDTVADSTLMAGPGSHAPAYALPPTMAREETAATSRRWSTRSSLLLRGNASVAEACTLLVFHSLP